MHPIREFGNKSVHRKYKYALDVSFWIFAYSTEAILRCLVQNLRTICLFKKKLCGNKVLHNFNSKGILLRKFSDFYFREAITSSRHIFDDISQYLWIDWDKYPNSFVPWKDFLLYFFYHILCTSLSTIFMWIQLSATNSYVWNWTYLVILPHICHEDLLVWIGY